jgi:hypothetical protein
MKKYLLLFLFFVVSIVKAQSVNEYKYAIVPAKFSFLNEVNQYRLNNLCKLYLEKYGFVAYYDTDVLPIEIASTNCNRIYFDVENSSSMFVSKLTIVLKDCKNTILFKSEIGKSKEKEYAVAYNEALRDAFLSIDKLNYHYKEVQKSQEDVAKSAESKVFTTSEISTEAILNGYLLIDAMTSKVILKLLKTASPDVFIAQSKTKNGIVTKRNNQFVLEYYENDQLISELLQVKL